MRDQASIGAWFAALCAVALAACAAINSPVVHEPTQPSATLSVMAQIGQQMFFDASLSGSGRQSCASCHDPDHAFGPANGQAVQSGGVEMGLPGLRAVPSLAYKVSTPAFSVGPESLYEIEGPLQNGAQTTISLSQNTTKQADLALRGGFTWDGRADTLQAQALAPLTSPFEMANPSREALIAKLRAAPYAGALALLAGEAPGSARQMDGELLLAEAQFALARFQVDDPRFHAFTSKYDFYLRGQASLTAAEQRGLALFDDPAKGGCAECHLDRPGQSGEAPVFTDYEFEALGLPRNPAIPANADPAYFDLGVCGPLRDDARQPENCGLFKTPTLRNAATRQVFFHNGAYSTLRDAVAFYVLRDTQPAKIYPIRPDGTVDRFNDLPPPYQKNIDVIDPPLDRKLGAQPALNDQEIDDVVAFIGTLTDGYRSR
ncbi:MAG: hypothetical protein JWM33_1242 [Caulobacteraceae bacterium]|nr:hypothetical protein [Caulobacteraceae bacterium]